MNQIIKCRIDQLNKGEIPNGYKKTDFGVFPCDWVTDNKLKDLGEFGKGKGIPGNKMQSEGVPCVGYGDIYMKYNFHFENAMSFVDEETAKDSQPITKGTLLFTGTGETAEEIGKCVCYNGEEDIYAGGDIITFVTQKVNPLFIAYQQYQNFIIKKKAGFGQGHSVVHIHKENLEKLDIAYPKSAEEQSRIAEILMKWDEAIELYQKEIEALQKLKKTYLFVLFPKKGETTPKYRFKGFTDPWEQRKLNEIVKSIDTGKSKFHADSNNGEYAILGSTSIIGYDDCYDYDGDFILTARVGANAGSLYRYTGKAKISDNTVFIQAEKNIEFVYYMLTKIDIKQLSFGTGQPLVKASELKNLDLKMPTQIEEQKRIGSFFSQLDNLITLHQRK